MKLRLGTRGSDLALWQANHVAGRLRAAGHECELVVLKTRGDRIDDVPLQNVEGKAFFTAEIERALLDGDVDLAVHSHKDLPIEDAPGLTIAAIPERAPAGERLLVSPAAHDPGAPFLPLREGVRVGTSAPRRAEQIRALRPDLRVRDLRGNVPTRVQRLREGRYDAIVLAAAGLERLGLDTGELKDVALPTELLVPAPAQGALAIQVRAGDEEVAALCARVLHDEDTARNVRVERALFTAQGGGCNLPLGASLRRTGAPGERAWRMRAFLGPDHPVPGAPARWVETHGADAEAAAAQAARLLAGGGPTRCGPLAPLRVALCGSVGPESVLAARLAVLGAEVVSERAIAFADEDGVPLAERLAALAPGDGLALTSREAARRVAGRSVAAGVSIAAVGPGTARVLLDAGHEVDFTGDGGARELARSWPLSAGARVLFPCAAGARRELEEELAARGISVERLVCYRTLPVAGLELAADVDARVYMSPSAVAAALPCEHEAGARPAVRVALGRATAEALERAGLEARAPERSNPEAVVRLLSELAAEGALR